MWRRTTGSGFPASIRSSAGGGFPIFPKQSTTLTVLGITLLLLVVLAGTAQAKPPPPAPPPVTLTPQEQLGKFLFFDSNLSEPRGQACAECHGPAVGYTGPDEAINQGGTVYEGAVAGRFGNRKPPASAYAAGPILGYEDGKWVGGTFWDGRATGWTLGDPLAEQAQGPFLNPLEQNNASAQVVIDKALGSSYGGLFLQVCGDPTAYYECVGRAIAAYERSKEVSSYTSKYDAYLKGQAKLTGQEQRGLELFEGKAQCANCHNGLDFTDFTYDNLGVPRNPANPFYKELDWNPLGEAWVDEGSGRLPAERRLSGRDLWTGDGQAEGAHAAQCGFAAGEEVCQGVWAQRLLQVAGGNRALL